MIQPVRIRLMRIENDLSVVFISLSNQSQFAPREDLSRYTSYDIETLSLLLNFSVDAALSNDGASYSITRKLSA
jgi:hypothetical protein